MYAYIIQPALQHKADVCMVTVEGLPHLKDAFAFRSALQDLALRVNPLRERRAQEDSYEAQKRRHEKVCHDESSSAPP